MARRLPRIVLAAALLWLFSAPRAAADPVTFTITDGFLLGVPAGLAPSSTMTGPGLGFSTSVFHEGLGSGIFHAFTSCSAPGCTPGDLISFVASLSTQNLEDGLTNAVLTLDGVRYDDFTGGQVAKNIVSFSMEGAAVAPPLADLASVTLTAPFTLLGRIGLNQDRLGGGDLFLLDGRGTATLRLKPVPDRVGGPPAVWEAEQIRYDFESPAAPIPEPSSMLLLGTGLAALIRSRIKRRE